MPMTRLTSVFIFLQNYCSDIVFNRKRDDFRQKLCLLTVAKMLISVHLALHSACDCTPHLLRHFNNSKPCTLITPYLVEW